MVPDFGWSECAVFAALGSILKYILVSVKWEGFIKFIGNVWCIVHQNIIRYIPLGINSI